jgi:hypothetical protein
MASSIIVILTILAIAIIITVIILRSTKENFITEKHLLYFYGKNCNGCNNVDNIWTLLQDKLKDNKEFKLERIDYDLEENKLKYPNITMLPTVLMSTTEIYNPNSENTKSNMVQYYATDIINWAKIPN